MRSFLVERFSLRADRCLNGWHQDVNCSRCADGCPVAAITLHEGNVSVSNACVNCGVCLRVCPTELFVEASPPEVFVLQQITHPHDDVWELACPLAQNENETTSGRSEQKKKAFLSQLPEANRLIVPRCLGALGASHLLQIADRGTGQVWLNDAACAACPITHARQQMVRSVDEANGWLAAFGRPPAIFLTSRDMLEDAPLPQMKRAVRVDVPHPRRGFFRKMLGLEGKTAVSPSYTPHDRQRLLPILASFTPPPAQIPLQGLGVTNVEVDEQLCSACGLCARSCPTAALRFLTDEEVFGLSFTASSCVDCGICAMICPETAVSFTNTMPLEELVSNAPQRLALGRLQTCSTCPALIAENGRYDQCFVCRRSKRPLFLKT
jgi:ferredoxin